MYLSSDGCSTVCSGTGDSRYGFAAPAVRYHHLKMDQNLRGMFLATYEPHDELGQLRRQKGVQLCTVLRHTQSEQ